MCYQYLMILTLPDTRLRATKNAGLGGSTRAHATGQGVIDIEAPKPVPKKKIPITTVLCLQASCVCRRPQTLVILCRFMKYFRYLFPDFVLMVLFVCMK